AGKLGKFFQLACDTEVARLVAIGELAPVIDGVVLTASGEVITLEYLLACRQAVRLFGVPVLARVPVPVTATELKCLWEAGVDGIVTGDIRSTAALRKAAEALPRGQRRKWGSRPRPVLPGLSGATSDEED
ncbi:MAG: hypothetical protein N3E40_03805, partial [Dehalococcoidia bacterium]|nr:hypothetical protein [Dehalococcoidia bacterium]